MQPLIAGTPSRRVSLMERLLLGPTSGWWLAMVTAVPTLAAAWVLLAPGNVFSREMTWDLLFNLAGAWHLAHGHVPHVDFHDPLGALAFSLTNLGFRVAGFTPRAFLVGELIVVVTISVMAIPIAARRLAPLPALVFTSYVALLILLPASLGDAPHAYTFAMSYNRWGWAALATLCVLLFIDPRRGRDTPKLDFALAGVLWVFLFYLKITFAVGATLAIVAAVVVVRRVRARARWWMGLVGLLVLAAAAPFNLAYLSEAWVYANSGYARTDPLYILNIVIANRAEYALYAVAIGLLLWLGQSGRAGREATASAIVLLALGLSVLTQNAQEADIPLGVVIWLLVYDTLSSLARGPGALPAAQSATILVIALAWPLLSVGAAAKIFAGYYRAATADAVMVGSTTNLRGLAVPSLDREVPDALARVGHQLLSSTRVPPLRDPMAQSEYLETLLEAAAQLADRPQKILVIDQVNPMPFMLGYPPPRGSLLWMGPGAPYSSAEQTLRDVDVVLVPKYSTYSPATAFTLTAYQAYLSQRFPVRSETASWVFLRRADAAATEEAAGMEPLDHGRSPLRGRIP